MESYGADILLHWPLSTLQLKYYLNSSDLLNGLPALLLLQYLRAIKHAALVRRMSVLAEESGYTFGCANNLLHMGQSLHEESQKHLLFVEKL